MLIAVMSCATVRLHCDCFIASLALFINIQTYLFTYLPRRAGLSATAKNVLVVSLSLLLLNLVGINRSLAKLARIQTS